VPFGALPHTVKYELQLVIKPRFEGRGFKISVTLQTIQRAERAQSLSWNRRLRVAILGNLADFVRTTRHVMGTIA